MADPRSTFDEAATPTGGLIKAVLQGDFDEVKRLLAADADPDERDDRDNTPLIIASGRGRRDIMQALIDGGANVDCVNRNGYTALLTAVTSLDPVESVHMLVEAGADLKKENSDKKTAPTLAREKGLDDLVSYFQQAPAIQQVIADEKERAAHIDGLRASTVTAQARLRQKRAQPSIRLS